MTAQSELRQPKFQLPLSDPGLILVGRITLMWSQVEHFMDEIISIIHGVPSPQLRILLGDRLTGQRMQILNKSLHLFKNAQTKKDAQQLYDNLEKIRQERNHITHGLWGWYNPDHDRYEAAALSHKVHPPFHHSKLVAHHNAVAEETHRVVKIFTDLTGLTVGDFPNFFFGPTLPERQPDQMNDPTQDRGSGSAA